jgi:phospholipid-translocating ATPase
MYFLGIALTQFVPILKVGFLFTFLAPLAFVLVLSIGKEAIDDIKRSLQDRRANSQVFQRLLPSGEVVDIEAADICVGHLVVVSTNHRVPADLVLLKTTDKSGASFIRTDQLDGETDWKLKRPMSHTQNMPREELARYPARIMAEAPRGDIYAFLGMFATPTDEEEPISVENMLWANTVIATGQVIGAVVYTGRETRSALNRSQPRSKVG